MNNYNNSQSIILKYIFNFLKNCIEDKFLLKSVPHKNLFKNILLENNTIYFVYHKNIINIEKNIINKKEYIIFKNNQNKENAIFLSNDFEKILKEIQLFLNKFNNNIILNEKQIFFYENKFLFYYSIINQIFNINITNKENLFDFFKNLQIYLINNSQDIKINFKNTPFFNEDIEKLKINLPNFSIKYDLSYKKNQLNYNNKSKDILLINIKKLSFLHYYDMLYLTKHFNILPNEVKNNLLKNLSIAFLDKIKSNQNYIKNINDLKNDKTTILLNILSFYNLLYCPDYLFQNNFLINYFDFENNTMIINNYNPFFGKNNLSNYFLNISIKNDFGRNIRPIQIKSVNNHNTADVFLNISFREKNQNISIFLTILLFDLKMFDLLKVKKIDFSQHLSIKKLL